MSVDEEQLAMGEGQHIEERHNVENIQGMEGAGEGKIENQSKAEEDNTKTAKGTIICPNCNGTGTLPAILQGQHHQIDVLFRAPDGKASSRVSDSAVASNITKQQTRLPPVHIQNPSRGKQSSAGQIRSTPGNLSEANSFLPKTFDKHPEDVARLAAIKLNRNDWETRRAGLEDCLQLAHLYPEELEPHMSLVYRTISSMLNGFHPNNTVFVCQAAREFFTHMRSTCRPEYDELIYALLARTADTNKIVRAYANNALDKMITFIPTTHAVRPLVEKGPKHNNPLVRTATARLLTSVVQQRTPNIMLNNLYLRETCKRIIETAALLLSDSNINVRTTAKKLISIFKTEEEFESIYYAEVDEKIRKRVHRTFLDIKPIKIDGSV